MRKKNNRFSNPRMRTELFELGPLHNLRELLERSVNLYKGSIIITEKRKDIVMSYSMLKLKEDVEALGTALLNLDLSGRQVAIVGENSYAWVVAYLAVVCSGLVAVPMDKELPDDGIAGDRKSVV